MNSSKSGYCIALAVYLSPGLCVFMPFFEKCNVSASLACAFLISIIWTVAISIIFEKANFHRNNGFFCKTGSLFSSALAVLCVLLIMTQVIEVTCFIVGKGVSRQYYLLLSAGLLFAGIYLCTGGKNGIFRFCMTGIIPLTALAVFLVLPFWSTQDIMTDFNSVQTSFSNSILCGIKGGIILSFDISMFLLCFHDTAKKQHNLLSLNVISLTAAFLYTLFCVICVYLLFGTNLTRSLTYPLFAQTKAFGSFDTTEAVSAVAIFAFIAKSAVYVRCAAKVIKNAFFSQKMTSAKKISVIIFLFVPLIFLPFLLFSLGNEYGKYQFMIYPATAISAVIFTLLTIFEKMENE